MEKKTHKLVALWLVVILSLLSLQAAFAKGPPGKVTIEGTGIDTPIEIMDPDTLIAFSFFQFENVERRIETPAEPGDGFTLTRYMMNGAELIPFDQVIYFPGEKGKAGVVYLEGMIHARSDYDGYWYQVYPQGDAAMVKILGTLPTASVQGEFAEELAANEGLLNPAIVSVSSSANQVGAVSSISAEVVDFAGALQKIPPAAYLLGLGLAVLLLVGLLAFALQRRHT